jgi:hypothetical protein
MKKKLRRLYAFSNLIGRLSLIVKTVVLHRLFPAISNYILIIIKDQYTVNKSEMKEIQIIFLLPLISCYAFLN